MNLNGMGLNIKINTLQVSIENCHGCISLIRGNAINVIMVRTSFIRLSLQTSRIYFTASSPNGSVYWHQSYHQNLNANIIGFNRVLILNTMVTSSS
jgi:hypothetical protein